MDLAVCEIFLLCICQCGVLICVQMSEREVEYPIIMPDKQKLLQLSAGIQKRFDLELLGIDLIIENATGRYAVIDVNAFPGDVYLWPGFT